MVVFGKGAKRITGVSWWKIAIIFASTLSKLQQTTNQLTTALPSTGHLGAATPPFLLYHDDSYQTKTLFVCYFDAYISHYEPPVLGSYVSPHDFVEKIPTEKTILR